MKVYTASKLKSSNLWIDLAEAPSWDGIEFTARWPTQHVGKIPDKEGFATIFWQHDLEDIISADVVLVYGEPEDKLRGALVEAGMGIALGKKVIVVGDHPDYGTWQYHPSVFRVSSLEEARLLLDYL